MRRRSRILRAAKWAGVVLCVAVALAWITSVIWWIGYLPAVDGGVTFHINHGRIHIWIGGGAADNPGWNADPLDIVSWGFRWPGVHQIARDTRIITIPFWLCLAVVLIPTIGLVWLDHRRRPIPGRCPCGYDLIAPGEAWERRKRCRS